MAINEIHHFEDTTANINTSKWSSMLSFDTTKDQMVYVKSDATTLRHLITADSTDTIIPSLGSITLKDTVFIGLGASSGRIQFDNLTIDTLKVKDARFDIVGDSGTLPPISADTFLLINNNSAAGDNVAISLIGGTTGNVTVNFGDSGDENIGRVDYDNNTNALSLWTNTAPRLTIDSSGNVGIGTITPDVIFCVSKAGAVVGDSNGFVKLQSDDGELNFLHFGVKSAATGYGWIESADASGARNLILQPRGGDVAINTVDPKALFHVSGDAGTLPPISADTFLLINNNSAAADNAQMSLISGTAGNSVLNFGDSGDENIGFIDYDNNTNSFSIGTNAAEALTISSAGNVGIGIASAGLALHVKEPTSFVAKFESETSPANIRILDNLGNSAFVNVGASTASFGMNSGLSTSNINLNSSGDLGVGLTAPGTRLHIRAATASGVSIPSDTLVTLEDNSGDFWLSFVSGDTGSRAGFQFVESGGLQNGSLEYDMGPGGLFVFKPKATSIMTVGSVGIFIGADEIASHLLHVAKDGGQSRFDQTSATGGVAPVIMDQADIDQEIFEVVAAGTGTGTKTYSDDAGNIGGVVIFLQINVNGTTRWLATYPTA